ncbi:uncharacterized protein LOC131286966 [Anopheles ziemanni]|uniref:uncharacterized protein LOC131259378 n=1 Tax=Anopheles coustani TaxID=139045 RepID=UPI0026590A6C|nr:uncharacterized protein LOC131259378 [Anopheles coustani]XP_058171960.1 uncharacterized protein LOC131286966 [Anopheles ziemanni]
MAASMHDKNGKPFHNGNGTSAPAVGAWYGNGLLEDDTGVQRPRRLSFNGSDMELSDLKAAAVGNNIHSESTTEKKIEPMQMVGLLAIATTLAVSIKYLLSSFDFAFFRSVATHSTRMATQVWQEFVGRLAHLSPSSTVWSFERMVPQAENAAHAMFAAAFGLLVASFTWYVIYLDSSIPGVNPPTPFSASKKRYRGGISQAKERRFHLGYVTAMVSGVVAFLIFLFE